LCKSDRAHNFELANPSEQEEEEEKHFGLLVTLWFGTFTILFAPLGVFILLTLEDEWYAIINYVR